MSEGYYNLFMSEVYYNLFVSEGYYNLCMSEGSFVRNVFAPDTKYLMSQCSSNLYNYIALKMSTHSPLFTPLTLLKYRII